MKIALITDTHFGARNESIAFNKFFFKFYNDIFFPTLERERISTVIHLGDVVDRRKFINYNTLNAMKNDFIFRLGRLGIDTHIIIGNHDRYYTNTNRVNAMQELFESFDGQTEPWIYTSPKLVEFDGLAIGMIPWINIENELETMEFLSTAKTDVLMGHLEIQGALMYKHEHNIAGLNPDLFKRFDLVMSGHFHHRSKMGNIYYLGNPYEITWSDYDDPRGFHLFDTATRELTFIENPYRMFYKIVYDDTQSVPPPDSRYTDGYLKVIVLNRNSQRKFNTFMDQLYQQNPQEVLVLDEVLLDTSIDTSMIDLSNDTLTLLQNYVDQLECPLEIQPLKDILRELYLEALNQ